MLPRFLLLKRKKQFFFSKLSTLWSLSSDYADENFTHESGVGMHVWNMNAYKIAVQLLLFFLGSAVHIPCSMFPIVQMIKYTMNTEYSWSISRMYSCLDLVFVQGLKAFHLELES